MSQTANAEAGRSSEPSHYSLRDVPKRQVEPREERQLAQGHTACASNSQILGCPIPTVGLLSYPAFLQDWAKAHLPTVSPGNPSPDPSSAVTHSSLCPEHPPHPPLAPANFYSSFKAQFRYHLLQHQRQQSLPPTEYCPSGLRKTNKRMLKPLAGFLLLGTQVP